MFKPMTDTTDTSICLYCHKPIGDATAVSMTARDSRPRIGVAHTDYAALSANMLGLNLVAAKQAVIFEIIWALTHFWKRERSLA
ncbi:MAG: hypothetical protein V4671_09030 [Armatimonadota bacterium]